jgi:hypothetical protein
MAAPFRIRRIEKLPTREVGVAPGALAEPVPTPSTRESIQNYTDKLIKLIPAEVLSLYLAGKGFLTTSQGIGIWALICLVLVIVVRMWGTKDTGTPVQWAAVVIAAISFVIWVYAVGDLFFNLKLPDPGIASVAVLAWTFIVPRFYKGD